MQQAKTNNYTLNTETQIGTWFDGTPMYELAIEVTIPSNNNSVKPTYNLEDYNMKEVIIADGFFKLTSSNAYLPIPWIGGIGGATITGVESYYNYNDKNLYIMNTNSSYNGATAYVILHYNKNN